MSETDNSKKTIEQQIKEMRGLVEKQADQATGRRPCPNCQQPVILHHGRVSGLWFYKHEFTVDCVYDTTGTSVMFMNRAEAIDAKEIFHEP